MTLDVSSLGGFMVSCRIWKEKELSEWRGAGSDGRWCRETGAEQEPIGTSSSSAPTQHPGQASVTAWEEAGERYAAQNP